MWLRWLPLSLHKIIDGFIKQLLGSRFQMMSQGKKITPLPAQNGGSIGLSTILEADVRHIASIARDNFEKYAIASSFDISCYENIYYLL